MSNKFSIMTTINLEKLDKEIERHINLTTNFNPYIFMNEDTVKAIADEIGTDFAVTDASKYKDTYTYRGYKIFINNDLKLGIVEIR